MRAGFTGMHGATPRHLPSATASSARPARVRGALSLPGGPPRRNLVWLTDAGGTLTFISDAARPMLGHRADRADGSPVRRDLRPERPGATRRPGFRWLARHPAAVHRMRLRSGTPTATTSSSRINGTGMTADGVFIGGARAPRATSANRDRLERDLRRQAGEAGRGRGNAPIWPGKLHDSVHPGPSSR